MPIVTWRENAVSVRIVAGRDDFAERGSVSRSTLRATDALDLSKRWAAGKAPAGHRPALLWLRLRCAALYRRFLTCQLPPTSNVLPITNRRYGRLKICATVNKYRRGATLEGLDRLFGSGVAPRRAPFPHHYSVPSRLRQRRVLWLIGAT